MSESRHQLLGAMAAPRGEVRAAPATTRGNEGQYRVADIEVFSAGDRLALVYVRDRGTAGLLRAEALDLLVGCRRFRTLEAHAGEHLRREQAAVPDGTVLRELRKLARSGFLVARDGLFGGTNDVGVDAAREPQPPISSVCLPTRDRVEVLSRALRSYAENAFLSGREIGFVVADDSPDARTREGCRRMLAEAGRRLGIKVAYVGPEEKVSYAARMAEVGGIPEDIVRFACLGDASLGATTVGGNRNSLLLHTVGEKILSADDDTVCSVASPPDVEDNRLTLDSGDNPLELWFHPDRKSAFDSVRYEKEDLLGLHERYLGRSPRSLLSAAEDEGWAYLDSSDPPLLRRVVSASGRILVTANGTVGDCGWDNAHFRLFQDGATFARLTRSAGDYEAARRSRELIQSAVRATITGRADPKFAMCLGLDNRNLLPPFPPVGRAEEVAFGALLSTAFDSAYAAHLPCLVQHDPPGRRAFPQRHLFALGLGSWLPICVGRFAPGPASSFSERLRGLGRYLEDLGRLPEEDFEEFVRLTVWDSMAGVISNLEERLGGADGVPDYWARDARAFVALARRSALTPVGELYALDGGREAFQSLLVRFGQVLSWWPDMVGAARRLRADGERLARPVRENT